MSVMNSVLGGWAMATLCVGCADPLRAQLDARAAQLAKAPLPRTTTGEPPPAWFRVQVTPAGYVLDALLPWADAPEAERPSALVATVGARVEPFLHRPMFDTLVRWRDGLRRPDAPGPGVVVHAPPKTPYGVVVSALYTAGQAELSKMAAAVRTPAGVRTLPIAVPKLCGGAHKKSKGGGGLEALMDPGTPCQTVRLALYPGGASAQWASARSGGCNETTFGLMPHPRVEPTLHPTQTAALQGRPDGPLCPTGIVGGDPEVRWGAVVEGMASLRALGFEHTMLTVESL